ncbi:hypothetical protein C823_007650 [Eubacterium plexicaudatum ASF492]|uniref:Uncharacterized protein n=1 Tax=Eubacterium plexicaudatum ASF492 TaxID=1235802 RepID=N2A4G1_9FIRM|nr:hypothetical protein C823_007650 [Eubacterium plexicaudatum ASF492]
MDIQNITNKETATQNEQQFKSTKELIEEIIRLFADNIISISDANYILEETSKKLCMQPVTDVEEDIKKIYALRNRGIIKS